METISNLVIQLKKLNCYVSDEADADEVMLKYKGKKIWPLKKHYVSMKGGSQDVNVEIRDVPVNESVSVELWDYDLLSPNDLLGTFKLTADKPGGPFNSDMMVNKKASDRARYNLVWELSR